MKIRLADGIDLDADEFVTCATGIIGKRGSGKSGTVKVVAEELHRAGKPFVILDPVGVHWGIRSSYDGKGPGLPVLVIGGQHGDFRLDRRGGEKIAMAIVDANVSCVIDFSSEPKAAYRDFVRDFADALYRYNETPRCVIIEEAPELVPQKVTSDRAATFEAVERLVSRGRNKNLGVVAVSQRTATIHKDVLTQIDLLIVGRLLSPQDRKALGEWVEAWDVKQQFKVFMAALASLPTRTLYFWSPERFGGIFKAARVRDFQTLHADKTHLGQLGLLQTKPVTTDVAAVVTKLGKEMAALAAAKGDPSEVGRLRGEVGRLTSELAAAKSGNGSSKAEVAIAVREAVAPLEAELRSSRTELAAARNWAAEVKSIGERLAGHAGTVVTAVAPEPRAGRPASPKPVADDPEVTEGTTGYDRPLKSGAVRMLNELASRHPLTLSVAQLASLAGFTARGGTFRTYMGHLKAKGYLRENSDGSVHVTPEGMAFAGEVPMAPATHDEAMARWRQALKSGAYEMLEAVVKRGSDGIDQETLASETGFASSGGTYRTYLGLLIRNGLVTKTDGAVRATDTLFPEAR